MLINKDWHRRQKCWDDTYTEVRWILIANELFVGNISIIIKKILVK